MLVTGLVKGFPGHKLGNFTHPSLNCGGKKYIYTWSFLAFQQQLTPTVGLDSLQDQSQRFQFVREPKAVATWSGEVGKKPGGKQRGVLKYVGGKQEDYFSYSGSQEF